MRTDFRSALTIAPNIYRSLAQALTEEVAAFELQVEVSTEFGPTEMLAIAEPNKA